MPRKRSLIKHDPSPSMSERQEARLLSKQLRKLENEPATVENTNLILRLSQRLGKVRANIERKKKGIALDVKRPVGRPPKVKPVEAEPDEETLRKQELERLTQLEKEKTWRETNPVMDQLKRGAIQANLRREREEDAPPLPVEAVTVSEAEKPTITATETGERKAGDPVVSPDMAVITKQAEESAKRQSRSQAQRDLETMMKPLEPRGGNLFPQARAFDDEGDDVFPCTGNARLSNSLLANSDRPRPVQ